MFLQSAKCRLRTQTFMENLKSRRFYQLHAPLQGYATDRVLPLLLAAHAKELGGTAARTCIVAGEVRACGAELHL